MKNPRFWLAVFIVGIVANALDFVVQGKLLTDAFYSKIDTMRHDANPMGFVVADFAAMFVLAWVYTRVASVFGPGAKGGATAGFFLGVLVNFPTFHFISLMFRGMPYALVWINTLYGIGWYIVTGAILGMMLNKPAETKAG